MTPYKRNILPYLEMLVQHYPIVAIIGARQVGKTTLAKELGPDWLYLDLEKPSHFDRLNDDPEFFFKQHPEHVIFDEAQLSPNLFAVLRSVVDENRQQKNRFIVTGSSSPELLHHISESLAGRVAIVELGTLKANEYYQKPLSELYQLFDAPLEKKRVALFQPQLNIQEVQAFWFKGGYPEPIRYDENFYQEWMTDYQSSYINRDVARLFPKLDKVAYRRFITMLGKLSGKIVNKSDLARSVAVTQPTINSYLDIADGTFIWRQLQCFEYNVHKRVMKMPRGHIRDSGLLHSLLHIHQLEQLQADPIAGFSFESFVIEEILKGLQDSRFRNVDAYYYRTHSGAEVDLVLQGSFGILPIEIKYGYQVARHQLRSLHDFIEEHHLPFGVLVNQSERMMWLSDTILQVPAGCL